MDDLHRVDLNLLLALQALLTEQHVTRAARRLHRSQPAVSHALAQLREIFQDPLLVRRGPAMALTPRAQELLEPLEQALGQINTLLHMPGFEPARTTRRFRLAMSDYAAQLILPSLMQALRTQAPGVDLAISLGTREGMMAQLVDGDIDVALGVFPQLPRDVQAETLFEEYFVSIADAASLPARGRLGLADWLQRPHVQVAMRPDVDSEIDTALAALGMRRRVVLVLPFWGPSSAVLAGTDMVLTVASRALEPLPADPQLRCFTPPVALPRYAFQQTWLARRETDPAQRWFRGLIRTCSQPLGGSD